MRKGFTLIELLIVIAILAILGMMLFGTIGGCSQTDPVTGKNYYDVTSSGVYQCVKTYTDVSGGGDSSTYTSKRVDLRPAEGGSVVTVRCDDDGWAEVYNSATLFAQFEDGHWYRVETVGFRQDNWRSVFPLVTAVEEVESPKVQAEEELP